MPRDRDLFTAKLKSQLSHLRTSASLYDAGHQHEAERLATTVANLVMEGGPRSRTRSLLTILGIKDHVPLLTTSTGIHPANLLSEYALAEVDFSRPEAGYQPIFLTDHFWPSRPFIPFEAWWSEPVIKLWGDDRVSRSDVVRSLRDNEGGSHIDEELRSGPYQRAVDGQHMVWQLNGVRIPGEIAATMRQNAWEIEASIGSAFANRRTSVTLNQLASAEIDFGIRPLVQVQALEIDLNPDSGSIGGLVFLENVGGKACEDAAVSFSVGYGKRSALGPSSVTTVGSTRVDLQPKEVEPIGLPAGNLGRDLARAIKGGTMTLFAIVEVEYAGTNLTNEGSLFQYRENPEGSLAARLFRYPPRREQRLY